MGNFEQFAVGMRNISFQPGGQMGEDVAAELAMFARKELDRTINNGEGSPIYDLFVNGQPAISENQVEVPGPILYVFSYWSEIIGLALGELIKRSPRKSGRYASSFIVLVNGEQISPAADIAPSAEVIITNVQPYTRKIEMGSMQMSVPVGIFKNVRQAMYRKVGGVNKGFKFEVKFLNFSSSVHPLVPYVLKTNGGQRGAKRNLMSSAFRNGRRFLASRKATMAGEKLNYPSLVMNLGNDW